MTRTKLYTILLLASVAGYGYLVYQWNRSEEASMSFCMIKNVTGFACPSCGTTRALQALFHGELKQSLLLNPFGILVSVLLVVVPIWIVVDWVRKSASFFVFYRKTEAILWQKWVAIPLILLVVLNWIWNIKKGL